MKYQQLLNQVDDAHICWVILNKFSDIRLEEGLKSALVETNAP